MMESLEPRLALAGEVYLINFQLDEATRPTGYLEDNGLVFGSRGNGLVYGWSADHTDQARERSLVADQRFDTLIHFEAGQWWAIEVPNGTYEVTVAVGDPANNDGVHTINVEGVSLFSGVRDGAAPVERSLVVAVTDGRLTVDQGAAADKATRINYITIVNLPQGGSTSPPAPVITEPEIDGQAVSPNDVHMETAPFSDPDGDTHRSTDWEIWTTGSNAQVVWQAFGSQGVERMHTHLGDGLFLNSLAGRTALDPLTSYRLRVRFRDSSAAVSSFTSRDFQTTATWNPLPLRLQGIAATPTPTWLDLLGQAIELPDGSAAVGETPRPAQLRIATVESATSLVSMTGRALTGNTVQVAAQAFPLGAARLVIEAGTAAVAIGNSSLSFTDSVGLPRIVVLPAVTMTAGQRLDFWVGSDGSTYYGRADQDAPDFSMLAREAQAAVPYVATRPGFVIEPVGSGYRLPVNIAFVPDPGPRPEDPLYFVTELYGSIQVVTRSGARHLFASGLLDYNPEGPISGSGEQGLTGIAVERDAVNRDLYRLYVTMLWDNGKPAGSAAHYPKVERLDSAPGGLAMAGRTVLLNMQPETQGQSHQVSAISVGPDGKLYVHNGDGFDASTALNLQSFRGKILRLNKDGSAPTDNPFFNATDGISAQDYVFAYGVRNPFGGGWRRSDGRLFSVENGPSVDRLTRIERGASYGWNGSNSSMAINALYTWNPATAPVNIAFAEQAVFAGSGLPEDLMGRALVSESGPTYAPGRQARGKRIVAFDIDASGSVAGGPTTLVEYVGTGRGTIAGLAAGPDGIYFTELYEDSGASGPAAAGARLFRLRFVDPLAGGSVVLFEPGAGESVTDALARSGVTEIVKRGAGVLILDRANTHSGGTRVEGGEVIVRHKEALGGGRLTVKPGTAVRLEVQGESVSLNSLAVESGGGLDVGRGTLRIVSGGYVPEDVRGWLRAAHESNGTGTVGLMTRAAASVAGGRLGSMTHADGSITVGLATAGDSNLDGFVDVVDVANLIASQAFGSELSASWSDGDSNYDGLVDVLDIAEFMATNLYGAGSYLAAALDPQPAVSYRVSSAVDGLVVAWAADPGVSAGMTGKKRAFAALASSPWYGAPP